MIAICKKCKRRRHGWHCFVSGIDPVTFDFVTGKTTKHYAGCYTRNMDGECKAYKRRWYARGPKQDYSIID